jgi:integrase
LTLKGADLTGSAPVPSRIRLLIARTFSWTRAAIQRSLASGVPINVVSQSMGHSDISTTLRVYAHVMPEQRRELARKMGSLLLSQAGSESVG